MSDQPHVYSTDNPDAVAAFLDARTAMIASVERAYADAEQIGRNKGPLFQGGVIGDRDVVGLSVDDETNAPDGWQFTARRGYLTPKRGKAGDAARAWLADHKPAPDPTAVMRDHGLPFTDRLAPDGAMSYRIGTPTVFEHDGTLWASYRGVPSDIFGGPAECTWRRRRLSEFHAAAEAHDEAIKAAKAAA